jgi:hypothetical protein
MAIQKVSVSTKAYSIPYLTQQKQQVSKDIDDFTHKFDVTEENLIELDYINEYPIQQSNQLVNNDPLQIEIGQRNNSYYRLPTAGVNYIDRNIAIDQNGVERDPFFNKKDIPNKQSVSRIAITGGGKPYKQPTWDWSADHAKKVWDESIDDLKENFEKIGDKAKQMGIDLLNSLTGFHPYPRTFQEELPSYVGSLYSLAYAPFMKNTATSPMEAGKSNSVGSGINWKNFFKDLMKNDSRYPPYPSFSPQLTSVDFKPYLRTWPESSNVNDIKIIANKYKQNNDQGLIFDSEKMKFKSWSLAYFLPSFETRYISNRVLGFYDILNFSKNDDYYLEKILLSNSIGNTTPEIKLAINRANGSTANLVTTIAMTDHKKMLAYWPTPVDINNKQKFEKEGFSSWRMWFYNINHGNLDDDKLIAAFYKRLATNDKASSIEWDYAPINVPDVIKSYTNNIAEKNIGKYFHTFKVYTIDNNDSEKRIGTQSKPVESKNFSPYAMIERIGPDFLQHKFDAYFLWDIYGGEEDKDLDSILTKEEYSWLSPTEKYLLSKKGFAVRLGQITIPKIINEDYTLSFLETEVKKVKSTKAMDNQSSFTLRLDQNLIWLDMINGMAGHLNTIDEHLLASSEIHPYVKSIKRDPEITSNAGDPRRWRAVLKLISKSWPPGSIHNKYNIKDSELCLVVKMVHLSNYINIAKQQQVLPYFVFENVRILGTSEKIQYNRESTEPQSIAINFIYKRCYEIVQPYVTTDQFGINSWRINTNSKSENENLELAAINPRKVPAFYFSKEAANTPLSDYKGIAKIKTFEDQYDWMKGEDRTINSLPEVVGE